MTKYEYRKVQRVSLKPKLISFAILSAAAVLGFGSFSNGSVLAITNTLISADSAGNFSNGHSGEPMFTTDGNYVAFRSTADDLVSGDTNGLNDIFVRDIGANTTERVSVSSSGTESNGTSYSPKISGNGRYVAFVSHANNIANVSETSTYTRGIYVHDRQVNTTEVVDVSYAGPPLSVGFDAVDGISEDGRFVVYSKYDDSLTAHGAVVVKDRLLNTISEVSKSNAGVPAATNTTSHLADISCDGRFVVFRSNASNLVSGDTNGMYDIFLADTMGVHDIKNITLAADAGSTSPKITCDGNYVLFTSQASNLVNGDSNGYDDAYVYDIAQSTFERASVDDSEVQYSGNLQSSDGMSISMDGRYVTYQLYEYAAGVSKFQIYVRDRATQTTKLASQNSSLQKGNGDSSTSDITFDGSKVVFVTNSTNLISGDSNGMLDIVVTDDYR